jgi:hypothetical protein
MKSISRLLLTAMLFVVSSKSVSQAQPETGAVKMIKTDDPNLSIELYTDRSKFEARVDGRVHVVDFDDIDTSMADVVPFAEDHYKGKGILIKGQDGQFVSRTFLYDDDYVPTTKPNMFAPGPRANKDAGPSDGGNQTTVTFLSQGELSATRGFGAIFIDADFPKQGACKLAIFDRSGKELAVEQGFSGENASILFRGMIAVDQTGKPVPAIARVQLINGSGWPEVSEAEGVTLDDFIFGIPTPLPEEP